MKKYFYSIICTINIDIIHKIYIYIYYEYNIIPSYTFCTNNMFIGYIYIYYYNIYIIIIYIIIIYIYIFHIYI